MTILHRLRTWWQRRQDERAFNALIRRLDWWHVEQLRDDREQERGWQ